MPRTVSKVPQKLRLAAQKKVAAYARVSTGKDAMLHIFRRARQSATGKRYQKLH